MSIGNNADWKRAHRTATSAAMKRMAVRRQCKECQRKMAMKTVGDGIWVCRWCGAERVAGSDAEVPHGGERLR